MFRSRIAFLFVTAAVLLATASSAWAQQPRVGYYTYQYGYNPGYYATPAPAPSAYLGPMYRPLKGQVRHYDTWYVASPPVTSATAPSQPSVTVKQTPQAQDLEVIVSKPAEDPVYVAVRGPDGEVRNFRVSGGQAAIQTQKIIVHAGEKMTLNILASKPATAGATEKR